MSISLSFFEAPEVGFVPGQLVLGKLKSPPRITFGAGEGRSLRRAASLSKKTAIISIITLRSYHSCNPQIHYKFCEASQIWYLAPHHRAAVSHKRIIITKQIIANEREQYGNTISYSAAYRVRASLREEFDGKEEDNFQ